VHLQNNLIYKEFSLFLKNQFPVKFSKWWYFIQVALAHRPMKSKELDLSGREAILEIQALHYP
jgi:hypothetical protein